MSTVQAASSPTEGVGPAASSRAEALLQSASLLLARGNELRAVQTLHAEIGRALGLPAPLAEYTSRQQAQEQHRSLLLALRRNRGPSGSRAKGRELRERLPIWLSWATTIAVAGGLTLRYAYALFDRARWQRENPTGNWISRYYPNKRFQGSPLLRYDVAVNHDWGRYAPAEGMARDHWSATWDTCLVVTEKVRLKLRLVADDRAKLIVDDVVRINVRKPGTRGATLRLNPGVRHVRVEYREGRRGAKVRLRGLNFKGTRSYHFQRPILEGDQIRCGEPARAVVSAPAGQ